MLRGSAVRKTEWTVTVASGKRLQHLTVVGDQIAGVNPPLRLTHAPGPRIDRRVEAGGFYVTI